MQTAALLERLVSFPTISRNGNRELVEFVGEFLADRGLEVHLIPGEERKANLFATLGPDAQGGIVLSGHTDVVPVDGQEWSANPFVLRDHDGKFYGRGTADMKGFLACALSLIERAHTKPLRTPLHLCLSYDEEIGCVGIRPMLDWLKTRDFRPSYCVVGEPTSMGLAIGHKGKIAVRAACHGEAAHSSVAPLAVNAIHLAADVIGALRRLQADRATNGPRDEAYTVPYTTIHTGLISGGAALNIVPEMCTIDFEIRHLGEDDPKTVLSHIAEEVADIVGRTSRPHLQSRIELEILNEYPGLAVDPKSTIVQWASDLAGTPGTTKVAFGTEAGLFVSQLRVPTIVCGPGSMQQGHTADEFISRSQLDACDRMMDRLLEQIA